MPEQDLTKTELIAKLQDIEWEDFEVKEAHSEIPQSSWETVSAFSNTAGGWLVFGVKKFNRQYAISGVQNPERIEHEFVTVLRSGNKFNKTIDVRPKKYEFAEGKVLAFYIPPKSPREKPVYFNSRNNTFIRTASGDQRATNEEIDNFFRASSFEEKDRELTNYAISDLDPESIRSYRTYFASVNPAHRYIPLRDEEFLEKMGLSEGGKINYGGVLLFGTEECLSNMIPQYRIEYLEIPGTSYSDAPVRYSFRITSEKNLFLTFFEVYEPLSRKINVPFSLRGGVREDDPPHMQAMREALVNLIIHTDYFSQASPRIRVFSDRIEFFNPGALPKKLEDILKEDFSQPRNPVLAKAFRYLKLAENIGSGFHKMIDGWKAHYGLNPVIGGDFDFYKITFPTVAIRTKDKTEDKTKDKKYDLNREHEIKAILQKNGHLSVQEIAAQAGISYAGAYYHVANLVKKGLLRHVGSRKSGHWEVVEK